MSVFPQTSLTLLHKLAVQMTGASDEAAWTRFFNLYTPAIRKFVEWIDHSHDPDDVIQDIYIKLVEILRSGRYNPEKAKFRSFLATMIRRHLISLYRKDQARCAGAQTPLDDVELSVPSDQAERLDLKWRLAKHEAAVEHVLTKTALSRQTCDIYREHVINERPAAEVAKQFGITKNYVGQIKFRVNGMIEVLEREYSDENYRVV